MNIVFCLLQKSFAIFCNCYKIYLGVIMDNENILKKKRYEIIIMSAVYIIFGILFCVLPNQMLGILETIIAFCCLVYGCFFMFVYLVTPDVFRDYETIIKSVLAIVIGLLLVFVKSFFVMAIGVLLAMTGVKDILNARAYKLLDDKKWWSDLVVGIILIVAGVALFVLCNTSVATKIVMIFMGLTLIIDGVANLAFIFVVHKNIKQLVGSEKEKSPDDDFKDYEVK